MQYVDSLIREDVLDFEAIHNVKAIKLVFELLTERVGSPISCRSIAEDVSISPNTVKKYLSILEALYIIFRVIPFSNNIARSLLKELKVYFFDTGLVKGDLGIRFENLVAVSLYKHVFAKIDYQAERYFLSYVRTKNRKEVDFALVKDDAIESLVEVKTTDHHLSSGLLYFHQKYQLPAIQVVKELKREQLRQGIGL